MHNLVVCTLVFLLSLASGYWGLPPVWYKSLGLPVAGGDRSARRIRSATTLDKETAVAGAWFRIRTAELRYLVLPERPRGTEGIG